MQRCPCCGDSDLNHSHELSAQFITEVANKTSILNKKWPTDTWFRRAIARKMRQDAADLEHQNDLPTMLRKG